MDTNYRRFLLFVFTNSPGLFDLAELVDGGNPLRNPFNNFCVFWNFPFPLPGLKTIYIDSMFKFLTIPFNKVRISLTASCPDLLEMGRPAGHVLVVVSKHPFSSEGDGPREDCSSFLRYMQLWPQERLPKRFQYFPSDT